MVSSEISHYCPASRSPHWAHWKEPQSDVGGESRAAPDPGALSSPTRERLGDGSPVVPLRSRARVCAQERVLRRAVDDRQSPPAAPGRRAECSPSPVGVPLRPRGQPSGGQLQSEGPFYKTPHVPAAGSALQTTRPSRTTPHLRALCTDRHTPPQGRSPGRLSVPNCVCVCIGHRLRCLDPPGVTAKGVCVLHLRCRREVGLLGPLLWHERPAPSAEGAVGV